jgi:XTP/dITP diphosphohydrolase
VLLTTSPRVAPGLLAVDAWDAVRAGPVLTAAAEHPQLAALAAAGVNVEVVITGSVSALADRLAALAADAGTCTWLSSEGEDGLATALGALTTRDAVRLEVLPGSWDLPGARLLDAVRVMDRLRSPGGCPWDAEQTHASLAPYLLEEAYETLQALEDGGGGATADLREELGDLLMQVLFHARLAQEADSGWSVDDVAAGLVAKLVRRHPHVFADTVVDGAAAVEANWDTIKQAEKQRTSAVDGVPLGQPALALAAKLVGRATKAGLPTSLPDATRDTAADELLGRALFGLAARAKLAGQDPEAALRAVARSYAELLRAQG